MFPLRVASASAFALGKHAKPEDRDFVMRVLQSVGIAMPVDEKLLVGLVGAFMTAAYMARCVYLTFFGEYRGHGHPHESEPAITVPLRYHFSHLGRRFSCFFLHGSALGILFECAWKDISARRCKEQ